MEFEGIGTPWLWIGFIAFVLAMLALVFVGGKMLLASVYKIPIIASLGVIIVLLGGAIFASRLRPPKKREPSGRFVVPEDPGKIR